MKNDDMVTMMTTKAKWVWPSNEEINDFPDPLGFENEWKDWPADMAAGESGPSVHAEIFSREYIQNSWDSIQEQRAALEAAGRPVPDHGIEFRFVRLTGDAAATFMAAFGLDGHRARHGSMTENHRKDNRLGSSELITGSADAVDILIASEKCGQGMFGPWRTGGKAGVVSRLKSALMHTRSDKNNQVSGGSWGHGKKAIANASKCRTVAVYTGFDALDRYPDDEVHTRFLGVSYWKAHDLDGRSHVGIGLLGVESNPDGHFIERFEPLEDDDADAFVRQLDIPGLEVRDVGNPDHLGTTYLIVEPSFNAADLARAIERNWWPLLDRHAGRITVVDIDGNPVPLQPAERPELLPFMAAAELAGGAIEPRQTGDVVKELKAQGLSVGKLGLTSDVSEGGWSYADPDDNRTVVALIRNDMVIAYEPFPRKQRQKGPYLRGALIVDRDENLDAGDLLRMSEPHLHNEWQTVAGNSVPESSAKFAKAVLDAIQVSVRDLRSSLKDDSSPVARRISVFSRIFSEGKAPSVTKPKPPKAPRRPFEIQGASKATLATDPSDPTRVRATTSVEVKLAPHFVSATGKKELEVEVSLGWSVFEEAGAVPDDALLDSASVVAPSGFTLKPGSVKTFVGKISEAPAKFSWSTVFFPDDWRIAANPEVVDPTAATTAASGAAGAGEVAK